VASPTIALLTDFGTRDIYAGVLKGVLSTLAPQADLIDLSHGVPAGDITAGALMLWQAAPYFPPQTVFLCVVDPGVGSTRRGIAAVWDKHSYVGPDNGLISFLLERYGEPKAHLLEGLNAAPSATFHGRDVFAPAAGHLAAGLPVHELGRRAERLSRIAPPRLSVRDPGLIEGEVLRVDRFGNLVTSIGVLVQSKGRLSLRPWIGNSDELDIEGDQYAVELPDGRQIELHRTFSDVGPGGGLAYIGSSGLLEIGINQGEAASTFSLSAGDGVQLQVKG
jgi:S-adenosylmethionine hydrolase